jgi:hypothetical protein
MFVAYYLMTDLTCKTIDAPLNVVIEVGEQQQPLLLLLLQDI